MSYLSHYDIMTHSHFDTCHHNKKSEARRANKMTRDSKTASQTHSQRLSICNPFSLNTSPSHDNLRRVSKSPLLCPFTRRRSGTLDWRVTMATSADSSRLIHTILAQSSTLHYCSIFRHHRTRATWFLIPFKNENESASDGCRADCEGMNIKCCFCDVDKCQDLQFLTCLDCAVSDSQ
jgi:hypothetical protein